MGGLIKGIYSYVDPVGSLIEVTYSMNIDKTNYMEERKVMKGYVNSQATGKNFLIFLCTLDPNEIWYFVTKIVLTYCEQKIVLVIEKNF